MATLSSDPVEESREDRRLGGDPPVPSSLGVYPELFSGFVRLLAAMGCGTIGCVGDVPT
jgi:hypothetical protein